MVDKTGLAIGVGSIAFGTYLSMVGAGIVPPPGARASDGPPWLVVAAGLVFLVSGVLLAIRASLAMEDGETELPRRAPFWLRLGYDLGGLTIVVALAALGSWIAFGPGERAFTGTGAIIPGSIGGMVGRAMFGFGAIVTWIYVVATVVSRVRKYIGSAQV